MHAQAINYIHDELSTIEALLSRTQGQTDDIKQLIVQVERLSDNLTKSRI
jgi:hypothetical protein